MTDTGSDGRAARLSPVDSPLVARRRQRTPVRSQGILSRTRLRVARNGIRRGRIPYDTAVSDNVERGAPRSPSEPWRYRVQRRTG